MKFLFAVLFTLIAGLSYAGRGAFLIIDNSSNHLIKVTSVNYGCLKNITDAAITLLPVSASNLYIEQDCLFVPGFGELELFNVDNNQAIATIQYSVRVSNTEAKVKEQTNPDFSVRALSVNTLQRFQDQDVIMVRITPNGKESAVYTDWMWQMHQKLSNKTLAQLVIPGTHDSLTEDLSSTICNSDPDANQWASFGDVGKGYAQAQYLTLQEQLERGLRYFDIRLCYQNDNSYPSHSLLSNKTFAVYLEQLADFLKYNSHEIVVLDFQLYGYNSTTLAGLLAELKQRFEGKFISYVKFKPTSTLAQIWDEASHSEATPNLIVILPEVKTILTNSTVVVDKESPQAELELTQLLQDPEYAFVWPRNTLRSPWYNTMDLDQLLEENTGALYYKDSNNLFVHQLVQTPDGDFILKHLSYSLRSVAYRSLSAIYAWQWASLGSNKLNIVIRDWSNGFDGAIFAMHANQL